MYDNIDKSLGALPHIYIYIYIWSWIILKSMGLSEKLSIGFLSGGHIFISFP